METMNYAGDICVVNKNSRGDNTSAIQLLTLIKRFKN